MRSEVDLVTGPVIGCYLIVLEDLPWEDVLFRRIFPHLSLKAIFRLRRVSREFYRCTTEYFRKNKRIELKPGFEKLFTLGSLQILTEHARNLRVLCMHPAESTQTSFKLRDTDLLPILQQNGNLLSIDLSNNQSISNLTLKVISEFCPKIKKLVLKHCRAVDDIGMALLVRNGHLNHIDVGGCRQITDSSMVLIAKSCNRLQYLDTAGLDGITDITLENIAHCCREMNHINISGCYKVTNKAVIVLSEYAKNLRSIQVQNCRDINENSLSRLRLRNISVDVAVYGLPSQQHLTRSPHVQI